MMDKNVILADLTARFGKKVLLTPDDIADVIAQSPSAQAVARHRQSFDIPIIRRGRRILISIYDIADWLARAQPAVSIPQENTSSPKPPPTPKRSINRPSIGKMLMRKL